MRRVSREQDDIFSDEQDSDPMEPTNSSMSTNTNETLNWKPEETNEESVKASALIFNKCKILFDPKEAAPFYFRGPTFVNASRSYQHVGHLKMN